MFGRFLELAIATADIAASVQFYERLGFAQVPTDDAWSHRYGVLTDGRIHIGLHEREMPSPSICFVLPELAQARARLTAARFEQELRAWARMSCINCGCAIRQESPSCCSRLALSRRPRRRRAAHRSAAIFRT